MNPVYIRLVVYALSTILGSIPAFAFGGITYEYVDGVVHLTADVEGVVTTILTAGILTGGTFKLWGVK